ncbi:MAG: helix-turn-helix transcriptional regulator [Steroidobacteraceae bacterium]
MVAQPLQLRWGVEQRLEFIEFRLFWEGVINRSDLVEKFGVSVPQASNDLRRYQEIAPRNIDYDKSGKRYVSGFAFKPVLSEPSATQYLAQLHNVAEGGAVGGDSWLSRAPSTDFMPLLHRSVSIAVLRAVLKAVSAGASLEIDYQSMGETRPEPTRRWITPHAFAHDGLRWHLRAYCHIDDKFKDFLLSRMLGVHGTGGPGALPEDDRFWHERFVVVLVPNPALSDMQRRMIAQDHAMRKSRLEIPVRKALLLYFQNRFRLDLPDQEKRPYGSPIVVKNRKEFDAALAEAST